MSTHFACPVTPFIFGEVTGGRAESYREQRGQAMSARKDAAEILKFFDVEDKDGVLAEGLDAMNTQKVLQRRVDEPGLQGTTLEIARALFGPDMIRDTTFSELAEGMREFLDDMLKAGGERPKSFEELCEIYESAPRGGDPQFCGFMEMLKCDETIGEDDIRKSHRLVELGMFTSHSVSLLNFMGEFADPDNLPCF